MSIFSPHVLTNEQLVQSCAARIMGSVSPGWDPLTNWNDTHDLLLKMRKRDVKQQFLKALQLLLSKREAPLSRFDCLLFADQLDICRAALQAVL